MHKGHNSPHTHISLDTYSSPYTHISQNSHSSQDTHSSRDMHSTLMDTQSGQSSLLDIQDRNSSRDIQETFSDADNMQVETHSGYSLSRIRSFLRTMKRMRSVQLEDYFPNLRRFQESAKHFMKSGSFGLPSILIRILRAPTRPHTSAASSWGTSGWALNINGAQEDTKRASIFTLINRKN